MPHPASGAPHEPVLQISTGPMGCSPRPRLPRNLSDSRTGFLGSDGGGSQPATVAQSCPTVGQDSALGLSGGPPTKMVQSCPTVGQVSAGRMDGGLGRGCPELVRQSDRISRLGCRGPWMRWSKAVRQSDRFWPRAAAGGSAGFLPSHRWGQPSGLKAWRDDGWWRPLRGRRRSLRGEASGHGLTGFRAWGLAFPPPGPG